MATYQDDPVRFSEEFLGGSFTDDVRCVMESVRDHEVTIARSSSSTGKTHGAAHIAVWFKKCFPESQVYTCAAPPEENLRRLLWGELGKIMAKSPKLFAGYRTSNLHVQDSPSSFITGVTIPSSGTAEEREAKFSGKHAPYLLFIVDEGDAVPEEVYRGIESCMSGGHVRLLILFNPRHQAGSVYIKERDRKANVIEISAFRHPNVVTGQDVIPGAVSREITVRRVNEWSRPLNEKEKPDDECFEVPEFLVGATAHSLSGAEYAPLAAGQRKIVEPALSYMVLGRYPGQADNQLINRLWISAARSRWDAYVVAHGEVPPVGTKPVMGQDVAELGQDENVNCLRYGGWVARFETWKGLDTLVTGERASELFKAKGVDYCNVDATGVGAGVWPVMQRKGCQAYRVMVASAPEYKTELGEFGNLRDQLYWSTREWLRVDHGSMLPPDERLVEELCVPTYGMKGGKIKIMDKETMRELLKHSPDRMESLTLTFANARRVPVSLSGMSIGAGPSQWKI